MLELEQYAQDIAGIRKSILAAGEALHIDHMKEQIDELTEEMNQPEFWNDTERSTRVNQKLGHLKNKLAHYEGLLSTADDIDTMMELAREENDEEMVQEVGTELASLKEKADALELETLMRGDYDDNDAVLSLHAGAGGTEAQDWTQMGRRRGRHQERDLRGQRRPCLRISPGREGRTPPRADQPLRRQCPPAYQFFQPGRGADDRRRRRRDQDRYEVRPGGHLPLLRRRRPERQQDELRCPHDLRPGWIPTTLPAPAARTSTRRVPLSA